MKCILVKSEGIDKLIPYLPINLRYHQVSWRIKKLSHKLGFKIESHGLRRYAGTSVAETHGILVTQKMFGHSSVQMTQRYIFVEENKVRRALESLGKISKDE